MTGFFGGLSGHQGAFRSAFLIRLGLPKESFIATGVAISAAIDVSRITAYLGRIASAPVAENAAILVAATSAAFLGALVGNHMLKKVTLRAVEVAVATMLILIAVGLGSGVI